MSFERFLRLIKQSDPVVAGSVNRPVRQVDQNVRYLWDALQAAGVGSTVYLRRQSVEEEAKVGMAVYLNSSTQRFERCLAVAQVDDATGIVSTAASAQAWGIVAEKINATLAEILVYGVDSVDISQAVAGTPTAGLYYMSGGTPGFLTQSRPPVSALVLRRTADGKVFVCPQFVDALDRHSHYKFTLACVPAGTTSPPNDDGRHAITDPDEGVSGWLPADHASFGGKAPPQAVFGYNIAADQALSTVWPPLPLSNAYLEWDKGVSRDVGATGVPTGTGGLVVLNADGIWWMSDCYGDVPWPANLNSGVSESLSASSNPECPRDVAMAMTLYFTRVNFATDSAVVLSLRSGDDRIRVRCFGDPDRASTTGHLELVLDLNLTVTDDEQGYLALKEFDPDTSNFKRGPVAEGVYALSSNVSLAGAVTTTREIDSVEREVFHGPVGIAVDPADTKELDVVLVRLDGAEEAFTGDPPIMYLEFAAGDAREYRAKVHVPYDLAIPDPQMRLRFWVLGRAVGTLPQLTFTARVVPRPAAGLDTPLALPGDGTEFSVTCDTSVALASTNLYVEAESEPFDVAPGDTVYFTVARSDSDGYSGAVGILRQSGVVSTTEA